MGCPFLREGRARYCHAAAVRKMILDGPGTAGAGRCASPEYRSCALVQEPDARNQGCPHLEEVHVQYCGASPVVKLVPFSDSQSSPCGGGGYRYCDAYLGVAHAHRAAEAPPNALYAPNHLWIEIDESGLCHLGIDRVLAEVAGKADGVTFVTAHGTHRPAVALAVNGVEWPMRFPNPILIQRVNSRLRSDAAALTADPYGAGWLFEGWEVPGKTRAGLIGGPQASAWMAEERERLAQHIHETQGVAGDGGYPVNGVARLLPRTETIRLFQMFFAASGWMEA